MTFEGHTEAHEPPASQGAAADELAVNWWRVLAVFLGLLGVPLAVTPAGIYALRVYFSSSPEVVRAQHGANALVHQVIKYKVNRGSLPGQLADLVHRPTGSENGQKPLSPDILNDPWGEPYQYHRTDGAHPDGLRYHFTVCSKGPDKTLGTQDDINVEQ